jgi:hypothetical protein
MAHPFAAELKEYQFAINHLVPTVPSEVKEEAQKLHDSLLANANAGEEEVLGALIGTGKAEYPYRKAYQELQGAAEGQLRRDFVLDHVDEPVREKLKTHLDAGVDLDEVVKSSIFETDFTPEERYQIEHGILDATEHIEEEGEKIIESRRAEYDALVEKWRKQAGEIELKIDTLEAMASKDPKWKDEILGRVKRFREGFLVTESDPELDEVKKEIEYWKGVFGEEL